MQRPLAASLACLAALAGCGDSDDEPVRTETVAPGGAVRVIAKEYSFDPGRIEAGDGAPLRVTLVNDGSLAHDLKVLDGDREVGGIKSFPAGEERRFSVDVPAGSYSLVCTVADHREKGMVGELRVERPG